MLELLTGRFPEFAPQRFGWVEPLRETFGADSLRQIVSTWGGIGMLMWKASSPSVRGSILPEPAGNGVHASVSLWMRSGRVDAERVGELLLEVSALVKADFGLMHIPTGPDIERGLLSGSVGAMDRSRRPLRARDVLFGVTTHDLVKSIPDLYWGTVFGEPYVRLFGRERLLSAPVAIASELEGGLVYLQLTNSLDDLKHAAEKVEEVRVLAKKHLGDDAFFRPGRVAARVAQFTFGHDPWPPGS